MTTSQSTIRLVDEMMYNLPPSWRYRWCEGGVCACMGCVGSANRTGRLPALGFTKEDWEAWKLREEKRFDGFRVANSLS